MQTLKIDEQLNNPTRDELKYYLDKGYIFRPTHTTKQTILKDTSYSYSYRFNHQRGSDSMSGAWIGSDWIVVKSPTKLISFKKIIQCN